MLTSVTVYVTPCYPVLPHVTQNPISWIRDEAGPCPWPPPSPPRPLPPLPPLAISLPPSNQEDRTAHVETCDLWLSTHACVCVSMSACSGSRVHSAVGCRHVFALLESRWTTVVGWQTSHCLCTDVSWSNLDMSTDISFYYYYNSYFYVIFCYYFTLLTRLK